MKIQITHDDILKGRPCNAYECPAALALQRIFGTKKISVRECYISFFDAELKLRQQIPTPHNVLEFIIAVDSGESVAPIEFELELLEVPE